MTLGQWLATPRCVRLLARGRNDIFVTACVHAILDEQRRHRQYERRAVRAELLDATPAPVASEPEEPRRPLPAGTPITQVYDQVGGELLILGHPGSGKTTLLLELAQDLLKRAEDDQLALLPVVFNLSSWASVSARTLSSTELT